MRGSILLPISLAFSIILPSFSLLLTANNLPGLIDAGKTLSSQVNALRVPFDIDYAVSKYADEKSYLEEKLRSAWESAAKAKETSSDIQKILSGAKLSWNKGEPKIEIDLNINNREAEARGYFESAVKDSYYVLQGLVDLLDSDKEKLDLLGADNLNFSKSQVFYDLFEFLDDINSETGRYDYVARIEANPCSIDDMKHQTICIIRQMGFLQKPSAEQAVSIFNQVIGYPGPSLLEDYFEYHKNLSSVMLQMHNDYDDSADIFDQRVSEVQEKLAGLKGEKIFLVNQEVMNTITGQGGSSVLLAPGQGSSFSEKFVYLGKELEAVMIGKANAERTLEQKQDDYLFIATEETRELDFLLSGLLSSVDSLQNSLSELRDRAKSTYDRLLRENAGEKTTSLYLIALGIGSKSKNSMGDEIVDYSKAISYLSFVQSSDSTTLTLDSSLDYLKKVLKALDGFGLDVSYEKEQYDRLIKINDERLYPSVYLSVQELISKLRGKADFGIRKVYALREKLADYFADYRAFLAEPSISSKLNEKKIDELERDFENSLTFDELSNLDALYKKYQETYLYLGSEFNSIASEYLSRFIAYSYDFESPVCQNLSRARVLLSVKNPSSVAFSEVTLSKKHNLTGDLENPLLFYIDSIGPGEIEYKEYSANLFYNCSNDVSLASNKTQTEKKFFEISNRIAQLSLFRDCSKLKKTYKEAYSDYNTTLIEDALSDEIDDFLSNFTAKTVKKRLERIELMLDDFEKAVDSKVDFEHNISLVYSASDYSQASSERKKLKAVYDMLSPISFSSKSSADRFDELVSRFSPIDIMDFFDNALALDNYLNSSLDSVRNEAKSSLLLAKQNFDSSKQGYDNLKKAMDYYNKGNYNRAILLASLVPNDRTEQADFTYLIYLMLAIALSLFCLFLIRKPKRERKIVRRLLHHEVV